VRIRLARLSLVLAGLLAGTVLVPVGAHAQDPAPEGGAAGGAEAAEEEESPEMREAMERFEGAQALFDRGDYNAALAEFQRIYDLLEGHSNRYFVLFNLARSYEELHRYDRAIELYQRYLEEGGSEADGRADVEASLRALERLLGTVAVTLTGIPEDVEEPVVADVWIGDYQVGTAPGEVRVPGGQHVLEIRARGYETVRQQIEVASRQRIEVSIALSRLSDYRGITPVVFITTTAVAVLAAGAGFGLGGHAMSLSADAESCLGPTRPGCRLDTMARQQEIQTVTLAADVLFATAGVFAITSVVLAFLTDWGGVSTGEADGEASATPSAMLLPVIGPSEAGATLSVRF
jgi:hypothetical protein